MTKHNLFSGRYLKGWKHETQQKGGSHRKLYFRLQQKCEKWYHIVITNLMNQAWRNWLSVQPMEKAHLLIVFLRERRVGKTNENKSQIAQWFWLNHNSWIADSSLCANATSLTSPSSQELCLRYLYWATALSYCPVKETLVLWNGTKDERSSLVIWIISVTKPTLAPS